MDPGLETALGDTETINSLLYFGTKTAGMHNILSFETEQNKVIAKNENAKLCMHCYPHPHLLLHI